MAGASFTTGHTGSVSSVNTASKTWASGNVYIFTVTIFDGTAAVTPTMATCTQVINVVQSGNVQITVFRFKGDGTTGTKTIDCGGTSQTSIQWTCDEFTGLDTTGTNAANAFVQSVSNIGDSTSTLSVTLAAFGSASNNTWCFGWNQGGDPETAGAGFTGLSSETGFYQVLSQYKASSATSPTMTQSGTSDFVMIGIELKVAGGTDVTVTPTGIGMTSSLGTPVVTRSGVAVLPTGIGMTASLGTPIIGVIVTPTGIGMVSTLGTFTTQNDITLLAVGVGMTASLGTPTRVVTKPVSGIGMTMSLGTPTTTGNPTTVPTGMSMTASLGTPTVTTGSNPTITPSGLGMTFTLGTPTISTFQQVTITPVGFGMVSSLGSPTVSTGNVIILLLGNTKQLNTSVTARQLVTTPIVKRPRA